MSPTGFRSPACSQIFFCLLIITICVIYYRVLIRILSTYFCCVLYCCLYRILVQILCKVFYLICQLWRSPFATCQNINTSVSLTNLTEKINSLNGCKGQKNQVKIYSFYVIKIKNIGHIFKNLFVSDYLHC